MILPSKKLWLPGQAKRNPFRLNPFARALKDAHDSRAMYRHFPPARSMAESVVRRMSPGYPCCCEEECIYCDNFCSRIADSYEIHLTGITNCPSGYHDGDDKTYIVEPDVGCLIGTSCCYIYSYEPPFTGGAIQMSFFYAASPTTQNGLWVAYNAGTSVLFFLPISECIGSCLFEEKDIPFYSKPDWFACTVSSPTCTVTAL